MEDIKVITNFIEWTYDNNYLYSHSHLRNTYGWLTKEQILHVGNMDERDKLRKTTPELFSEYLKKNNKL